MKALAYICPYIPIFFPIIGMNIKPKGTNWATWKLIYDFFVDVLIFLMGWVFIPHKVKAPIFILR